MANSETTKRPEYHAWLIRHAGWVSLLTIVSQFLLFPLADFLDLPVSSFRDASFLIISGIVAPVFYSALTILIMRWFGAREGTIKKVATFVFILLAASYGIIYWINANEYRWLLSKPA